MLPFFEIESVFKKLYSLLKQIKIFLSFELLIEKLKLIICVKSNHNI